MMNCIICRKPSCSASRNLSHQFILNVYILHLTSPNNYEPKVAGGKTLKLIHFSIITDGFSTWFSSKVTPPFFMLKFYFSVLAANMSSFCFIFCSVLFVCVSCVCVFVFSSTSITMLIAPPWHLLHFFCPLAFSR